MTQAFANVNTDKGAIEQLAGQSKKRWKVESAMEDAQGFLGHPEVGFFSMLLIGVIAGWIAEKVTESDHSIFTNILVGIAGSFVGGALASLLNIQVFGFIRTLVSAIVGAILILFIWHWVHNWR
jgi:uncharacterized membrane protein YeaQ/YmgE (transglycosylase-associated protein family)